MAIFADFGIGRKYFVSGWALSISNPERKMGKYFCAGLQEKKVEFWTRKL
jgi:hypothetical protein